MSDLPIGRDAGDVIDCDDDGVQSGIRALSGGSYVAFVGEEKSDSMTFVVDAVAWLSSRGVKDDVAWAIAEDAEWVSKNVVGG